MKKALWLVPVAVLLVAIVAIAGCGGSSGKSTTSSKVTEASLGAPIYPGATQVDISAERSSGGQTPPSMNGQSAPTGGQTPPSMNGQSAPTGGQGGSGLQMTALWTKDSLDKVVSWYRNQLKGKTGFKESTGSGATTSGTGTGTGGTSFSFTSGSTTKNVMIRKSSQSKGGTVIMIGDMPQGMPSGQGSGQNSSGQTY